MRDRLGIELQDRGVGEFRHEGDGLLLRGGDPGRHDGDAVQLEQPLRFGLGQEGPPRGQDGGDQLLGPGAIGAAVLAAGQHRCLVQAADVLAVAPHVVEGAGGGVGVGERRDAGAVQDRLAGRDLVAPHPTGQHRLAGGCALGLQLVGGLGRVGHRLGRQDHQHTVGVRVLGDDLQRPGIAVGAGVAEQVDGVAVTPGRREDAVERLDALGRQGGQLAAAVDQGIGGEHAGAARVGQDRQARALQPRLGVEDLGHAEQLGDPVHAQHAAAAEGGIEHRRRCRSWTRCAPPPPGTLPPCGRA